MAMMMGGLASGINTNQIIDNIMAISRKPIDALEQKKSLQNSKLSAFQSIRSTITDLQTALNNLNSASSFATKKAVSSDDDYATVSASSDAIAGIYDIDINQLAQRHRISSEGVADTNATPIAAASGTLKFQVGSGAITTINVTSTTTLQDIASSINRSGAEVTASIVNDGSSINSYRLILSSNDTGSSNSITVSNNDTNLDFANKQIETAYATTTNSFDGTATSSGTYTGTANKTYVVKITTAGAVGAARFAVSEDNGLTYGADDAFTTSGVAQAIYKTTSEGVQAEFAAGTVDFAVGDTFVIKAYNPELQAARDAEFTVNSMNFTSSENTITDDAIPGVTLELLKTTSTDVTVSITEDNASVKSKIEEFVSAYNSVITLVNQNTNYNAEDETSSILTGDGTASSIVRMLQSQIASATNNVEGSLSALSQIGIKTEVDGTLKINGDTLDEMLTDYFNDVQEVFIKRGRTENSSFEFLANTDDTVAGEYNVTLTTAPTRGEYVGGTALGASTTITTGINDTFQLVVDGVTSGTITLAAGSYSRAGLASEVQSKINADTTIENSGKSVSVSLDGSNRLDIQSAMYGNTSTVTVVAAGNALASLGIDTSFSETTGIDVAGTINGHAATGSGNVLTGADGYDEKGLSVTVTATSTGSLGNVTLSFGVSERLQNTIDTMTDATTGVLTSKTKSLSDLIGDYAEEIERKETALITLEDRLVAQFSTMERLISQMKSQSSFLSSVLG